MQLIQSKLRNVHHLWNEEKQEIVTIKYCSKMNIIT